MERIINKTDLLAFKNRYQHLSRLEVPLKYLMNTEVYVIRDGPKMIAGFVLGKTAPYRTVDVFISDKNKTSLPDCFASEKFCELCCFWIDEAYRNKGIATAKIWMSMAKAISNQEKEHILYGTNSNGLAKIYGYPKVSLLFMTDQINKKETFVFIAKKTEWHSGVKEIVESRLKSKAHYRDIDNKQKLKSKIYHELSI